MVAVRNKENLGEFIVTRWIGFTENDKLISVNYRYFADQPLLAHPAITDRHLVMFAFEDWLKKFFFSILQILEVGQGNASCYVGDRH